MKSVCAVGQGSELVILMGLPATGKSTIGTIQFGESHRFYDCDSIKESHPDYDPKNPAALHVWSKGVLNEQIETLWNWPMNAVLDSTGTDAEKVGRQVMFAKAAGMKTRLLFVTVSQEVSLERNARRTRVVPEHVILEKAAQVTETFDLVRFMFDEVEVVDNSIENPALDDRTGAV
jgi:predicted kinase